MRISMDTSVIVDVERREKRTVNVLRNLESEGHKLFMSTVVPSEIYTGTYLREDYKKAGKKARALFSKFEIVPLDLAVAEIIGQINAYLIAKGFPVEFQDVAIAATSLYKKGDYLLTKNKEHFTRIPKLKERVLTPEEFSRLPFDR